jgi:diguanylate cyclase (GGDEF)-like protein
MTDISDDVQILGLLIQATGAALIGLLCLMLNRVVQRAALTAWSWAWLTLAGALVALLIEHRAPTTSALTLPLYMFGKYLFGYWIVVGCAHFGGRPWSPLLLPRLIVPFAVAAIAIPPLVGYQFRAVFMVQSFALAFAFASALIVLKSALKPAPSSPGLFAMRSALLLLIVTFVYYIPIFGANVLWNEPLPMTLLKLSSAMHLVLEFLLGFGGAVLVLEQSHHRLAAAYDDLATDNLRYRVKAERDALTKVPNRHAFISMLERFNEAEAPVQGCVALIDVDNLKQVNDRHGHIAGDAALVRVATVVAQLMRCDDRLFRWGGDEFLLVAICLPATEVATQLNLLNPELAEHGNVSVAVSYGVAEFSKTGELLDAVARADLDMYARKREHVALRRRMGFGIVKPKAVAALQDAAQPPAPQPAPPRSA